MRLYPDAYGTHVVDWDGRHLGTIMSYDGGLSRIFAFSNPAVNFGRTPLGTPGERDNARAVRDGAAFVARYER